MSVATTYAEALYESAAEAGTVDAVTSELASFATAMRETAELRAVLENPEIDLRQKKGAVAALAEGANPLVANFLQVLLDRGRISELPEISDAVQDRVARAQERLEVEAVTAVPLDDALRATVVESITAKTGKGVDLTETVDPEIVGGLMLRIGGVVVDGSVRHRLEQLGGALRRAPVDAATADA